MEKFEIGDVVMLKSSDTQMTVAEIQNNEITCTWIDSLGFLQNEIFNAALLVKPPREYNPSSEFL